MDIWTIIEEQISQTTQRSFQIANKDAMGGGCINAACRISDADRHYFVKVNHARFANMLGRGKRSGRDGFFKYDYRASTAVLRQN